MIRDDSLYVSSRRAHSRMGHDISSIAQRGLQIMPERGILLCHGCTDAQNCSATYGPLPQVEPGTATNKKSVPQNVKVSIHITWQLILHCYNACNMGQSHWWSHGPRLRTRHQKVKLVVGQSPPMERTEKQNLVDAEEYTNIHLILRLYFLKSWTGRRKG